MSSPSRSRNPYVRSIGLVVRRRALRGQRLHVPVVDAEALIGLKLQALVNSPARRSHEEADIRAIVAARGPALDEAMLRDYFALFDREHELDDLLAGIGKR